MPDLTILHTNDFHGKLTDHAAQRIAHERSEADLLLDAGDAVSSGNVYFRPGGEPILVRMSDLGYDAMTMGNREFHFLGAGLKSKVKLARFPILSANLRSKNCEIGPSVVPSVALERNGLKIGVFGLSVPMITPRMKVAKFSPFWFEDPIQAAAEVVPSLRSECDVLIALTHIGFKADMELARTVSGIDLVVGGHSHAILEEPVVIGQTAIVQAGSWGRYLGKTEFNVGAGRRNIIETLIDLQA